MLVYILGDQLELVTPKEVLENGIPAVFLTTSKECKDILAKVGIHFDGDVELEEIYFCKVKHNRTVCMEPYVFRDCWMCWAVDTSCSFLSMKNIL